MPRVDVYVRNADWVKWEAIEDKPDWLHLAISGTDVPIINRAIHERKPIASLVEAVPEATLVETQYITRQIENLVPRGKQCKNGHSIPDGRSKCMGKGCKYAN